MVFSSQTKNLKFQLKIDRKFWNFVDILLKIGKWANILSKMGKNFENFSENLLKK